MSEEDKCRFCGTTPSYTEFHLGQDYVTEDYITIKCLPTCVACIIERLMNGKGII